MDKEPDDANDDGDSNGSKDDDESLVEGKPPARKPTGKTGEKQKSPNL